VVYVESRQGQIRPPAALTQGGVADRPYRAAVTARGIPLCALTDGEQIPECPLWGVTTAENRLIALLPLRERLSLLADREPVQLELGAVLCEPGEPTRHVYFPLDCFISLVTATDGQPGLEVGMIGREGIARLRAVVRRVRGLHLPP
jgi:hypothetical protein